ncbi:aquaporin [Candidatus Planktophila lacus]|jgi:glycerol uptake facilitator-like aquaporin|uniref:MIP family permease n=1 Tax=Candidatus Planktophila lacus TaxID=1884913 RepID=A0AAC9YQC6_9ACTN|nr:MIP/aquaporin family protein [Candidatus Planktophila lacus]ASY10486.1 MIP family permease [Candidatus Planktophila lacus]ASY24947.1 MIP family permease [Candidatus Planktophila lacus]
MADDRHVNLRKTIAEAVGTATLLLVVIGSGVMATNLSKDVGVQLTINSAATGLILYILITLLGPISGAHFNPVVTAIQLFKKNITASLATAYLAAQLVGAVIGVALANFIFNLPIIEISQKDRTGAELFVSEILATAGLVFIIFTAIVQKSEAKIPVLVGAYISAAYFFTSSTSFANPAVTVARTLSDTFAGIAPGSVLPFIAAQIIGAALGLVLSTFINSPNKTGNEK